MIGHRVAGVTIAPKKMLRQETKAQTYYRLQKYDVTGSFI